MDYIIKRGSATVATIIPTGSQKRALMGQDTITCSFTLGSFVQFAIGDSMVVFGKTYVLNRYPQIEKVSSLQYDYSATFEAQGYDLAKVQYMFLGDSGAPEMSDFPLTGDADHFIDLIVSNMNRASSGWSKGTVDDTDYVNISFSNDSCLSALSKIAQQFEIEFWIDDKEINMTKRGQETTLTFQYGKGKGLYSIERAPSNDKDVFSRLYVFGSSKNLPSIYGKPRLQLPGADPYIQKTDQFNNYGLIETTLICDGSNGSKEIYPHRTGTISTVTDAFTFTDPGMDFDVNDQLLPGIDALVHFQTGQLAGYEFTINSYNAATKTFEINPSKTDNGASLPDASGLKPSVGDTYVLLNIEMPAFYVTTAETELQTAGDDYYDANSNGREVYTVDCDPLYFKDQNLDTLNLGDFVTIEDTAMSVDRFIRMIGIERDLQYTFKYTLTLADTASIANIVREYFEQQNTQIIIRQNKLGDIARARRNWRNTADLEDMVFDPEGDYYTEKIKPGSIETLYLAVGAKAQNYSLNGVVITPNKAGNPANMDVSSGELIHYTLEVSGVGSVWSMTSANFTGLDPKKAYYLFARISTSALTGQWRLLESPVEVDSETGYYNLGVGVLFAVEDGYRSFEFNKGMTYIVGDMIKTGRIQSIDAQNYFDLTQGKFNLGSSSAGIDWDVSRSNTLTIRGAINQDPGGNTDTLPVFRGEWVPGVTYYQGNEVSHNGSTYRYISITAGNSAEPGTNEGVWVIKAAKGTASRIIYHTSESADVPPDLDLSNSDPQGWIVNMPEGDLIKLLATDTGDILATDTGLQIKIGTDTIYVWASTEQLDTSGKFVSWSAPTRITGREGDAGAYTEFRYKKNGSPTEAPAMTTADKVNPEPDGWSLVKPVADTGEYIWMITANKLGNGVMTTPWSTPETTKGPQGDSGPWVDYRGEWAEDASYHGGSDYISVVHYATDGNYYLARTDAGDIPVGTLPTDTDYWNLFGAQFESVATGLLLAQTAYVAKLIVGMLATNYGLDVDGKSLYAYLKASGAEIDFWDTGTSSSDESNPLNALVRIGKGVGYMQATGANPPGVSARIDDSYSELTSSGIFSNGGNVVGLSSTLGIKTNFSIVALLQSRNDQSDGISSALFAWDQTDSGDGSSKSYAGYFQGNVNVTGEMQGGLRFPITTANNGYTLKDTDVIILTVDLSVIYLPASPKNGQTYFFHHTAGTYTLDGNGNNINTGGTSQSSISPGFSIILQWVGDVWRRFDADH